MGYALCVGLCVQCRRPFGFNPNSVPSIRVNGVREPVCKGCITRANAIRKFRGIAEFDIPEDAYDPIEEHRLVGSQDDYPDVGQRDNE